MEALPLLCHRQLAAVLFRHAAHGAQAKAMSRPLLGGEQAAVLIPQQPARKGVGAAHKQPRLLKGLHAQLHPPFLFRGDAGQRFERVVDQVGQQHREIGVLHGELRRRNDRRMEVHAQLFRTGRAGGNQRVNQRVIRVAHGDVIQLPPQPRQITLHPRNVAFPAQRQQRLHMVSLLMAQGAGLIQRAAQAVGMLGGIARLQLKRLDLALPLGYAVDKVPNRKQEEQQEQQTGHRAHRAVEIHRPEGLLQGAAHHPPADAVPQEGNEHAHPGAQRQYADAAEKVPVPPAAPPGQPAAPCQRQHPHRRQQDAPHQAGPLRAARGARLLPYGPRRHACNAQDGKQPATTPRPAVGMIPQQPQEHQSGQQLECPCQLRRLQPAGQAEKCGRAQTAGQRQQRQHQQVPVGLSMIELKQEQGRHKGRNDQKRARQHRLVHHNERLTAVIGCGIGKKLHRGQLLYTGLVRLEADRQRQAFRLAQREQPLLVRNQ